MTNLEIDDGNESAIIKPVADAILKLLKIGHDLRLAKQAEVKIRKAMRDLLLANPDENKVEAAILIFAEMAAKNTRPRRAPCG